ncbi:MAG: tetratricopeptide repeat protein, partial [Bacteroidales bacterium]|nr:tetratricopeptide repeat protein [Bacteroidales bacterium]
YESFKNWLGTRLFKKKTNDDDDIPLSNKMFKCSKCNVIKPLLKHHDQFMEVATDEATGDDCLACSKEACPYAIPFPVCDCGSKLVLVERDNAYIIHTRSGMPVLVTENSHADIYEKIVERMEKGESALDENEKSVKSYDFRSYLKDYNIFSPTLLESGFWKLLLLKFKIGYWVGNAYTKAMFILSREDSLDRLFPSTRRYIELEGIVGESVVYHTILVLLGFWRNIPICLPIHTREKIGLAFNRNTRFNALQPHVHEFDKKTGICNLEIKNEKGIVICYSDLGKVYHTIGEYALSLEYYKKTLVVNEKLGDKRYIARSYIYIGETYRDLGYYSLSLIHLEKGLKYAQQVNSKRLLMSAYEQMSFTFEKTNQGKKALTNYKKFNVYKDSVLDEEKSNQIIEMQTRYETNRKEQENALLKNKNNLNEALIQRQRIIVLAVISILFLITFLV